MHRRTLLTAATSLVLAAAALHPPAEASTAADPAAEHVSFTQWDFGGTSRPGDQWV